MERIVKGRTATLTKTFTFSPTGTPTVALTRVSDGTTVTTGGVTGATTTWSYTIPSTSNTLLDTYVETWTAVTSGANQTFTDYIEVAGDVLFTLAEARAYSPFSDTGAYPDAALITLRTMIEERIEEDEIGRALVPRYEQETIDGDGSCVLRLKWPNPRAIRSVTVDGAEYTSEQLATLAFSPAGLLSSPSGWPRGFGNVTVGYEHGEAFVPERARRAALLAVREAASTAPDGWVVRREADGQAVTYASPSSTSGFLNTEVRAILRGLDQRVSVA